MVDAEVELVAYELWEWFCSNCDEKHTSKEVESGKKCKKCGNTDFKVKVKWVEFNG